MYDLRQQMIFESKLISESVDWIEAEIEKRIKLLDKCEIIDSEKDIICAQIKDLLNKLNKEIKNMDDFMVKYKKIIEAAE